jgi:uncharacterized SAM-binding protein YcdF (DUF218 family)
MGVSSPEQLAHYLAIETHPQRADLAFVFGTRHPDPAYVAADLYMRGVVPLVVVTGGRHAVDGRLEAATHLQILLDRGVPRERVIVEQVSTNTLENVTCAREAIAAQIGLDGIEAVVAVVKWYHSRRALMTLRRHFPAGTRYYAVVYDPPGCARAAWADVPEVARRVHKELAAIPRYLAAGHIVEIHRDGDAYV